MSWRALLDRVVDLSELGDAGADDAWGPSSERVRRAFMVLRHAAYYAHVGEPLPDHDVVQVRSWDEVLEGLAQRAVEGSHPAVLERDYRALLRHSSQLRAWWTDAGHACRRLTEIPLPAVARGGSPQQRGLFAEHATDIQWWLVLEILAPGHVASTYFREALGWLHAGRLPCGWDGDQPRGRMRVF